MREESWNVLDVRTPEQLAHVPALSRWERENARRLLVIHAHSFVNTRPVRILEG